jgi:hypothetical protein
MNKRHVIIAGASKCGTTSVFDWLSDHPEVCISTEKEPGYFLDEGNPNFHKNTNYHLHGLDGYQTYFEHCKHGNATIMLEATTEYIYQRTALEALPLLKPCPKIIFVLRKPSERIYSVYNFLVNNMGVLDRGLSFTEFAMLKDDSNAPVKRPISGRSPIEHSKYVNYISKWIERFGEENIRVLLFEHLKEDPIQFMKNLSDFISIDMTFWDNYSFSVKNKTYRVKSYYFHRLTKRFAKFVPERLKESLQEKLYNRINVGAPQQKSSEVYKILAALDKEFVPYNDKLSELVKIDLSVWK